MKNKIVKEKKKNYMTEIKDGVAPQLTFGGESLKKVSLLTNFRYDLEITDNNGEEDGDIGYLSTWNLKTICKGSSIVLRTCLHNKADIISYVLTLAEKVRNIVINYRDERDEIRSRIRYKVDGLKDWELVTNAEGNNLLAIDLTFYGEATLPVWQSEKEVVAWLKTTNKITSTDEGEE